MHNTRYKSPQDYITTVQFAHSYHVVYIFNARILLKSNENNEFIAFKLKYAFKWPIFPKSQYISHNIHSCSETLKAQ